MFEAFKKMARDLFPHPQSTLEEFYPASLSDAEKDAQAIAKDWTAIRNDLGCSGVIPNWYSSPDVCGSGILFRKGENAK